MRVNMGKIYHMLLLQAKRFVGALGQECKLGAEVSREEREDTRKEGICSSDANYIFTILGITAGKNNCSESLTELLLPCERAAPAQMEPAGHLGDNSNKIIIMYEPCFF